jgi:hypothetical protein
MKTLPKFAPPARHILLYIAVAAILISCPFINAFERPVNKQEGNYLLVYSTGSHRGSFHASEHELAIRTSCNDGGPYCCPTTYLIRRIRWQHRKAQVHFSFEKITIEQAEKRSREFNSSGQIVPVAGMVRTIEGSSWKASFVYKIAPSAGGDTEVSMRDG